MSRVARIESSGPIAVHQRCPRLPAFENRQSWPADNGPSSGVLAGRRFCPDNRISFLFADYELTVAAAHHRQLRYSQKFAIIQALLSVVQPAIAKCRRSGDCIPLVPMKLNF